MSSSADVGTWDQQLPVPRTGSHVLVAGIALVLSIAAFVVSTVFGIAVTFALTVGLCFIAPAVAPVLLIASFLYQNLVIANFGPMVPAGEAFDALRGANFVILVSASGAFGLAALLEPEKLPQAARPWILAAILVMPVILFYCALGVARGNPTDAIVYFRNILTPLGCLGISLVAAARYRIDLSRSLLLLGAGAVVFGYCEWLFTVDFLSLFHGDLYIERRLNDQIESGYWERILAESGFVLRGLEDVMTVPFLNLPILGELFPSIFRLSGPNFHPISFAYALSLIATWFLCRGQPWFFIAALPLLVAIGSKGALFLALFVLILIVGVRVVGPRLATLGFVAMLAVYIVAAVLYGRATGDYHVLGFLAGIRDFVGNPVGQGLGFGGNLSSSIKGVLSWDRSQQTGIADIPVESAIGVLLYQMGVGAFVLIGLIGALAAKCRQLFLATGGGDFLFGFAALSTILVNAVLQEEAIFSPLALGLALVLVGVSLGSHWRSRHLDDREGFAS